MSAGITVTWRADKRVWVGKYRTPSGDWPQKTIPKDIARGPRDRKKAVEWLTAFAAEAVPMGVVPRKRPGGRLLGETKDKWIELRRADGKTSPSRVRAFKDLFKNVVLSTKQKLGDEDIVTLGTNFSIIRAWIREATKHHGAYRVRSAFSALRSFYDDAIIEGWFRGANPLRNTGLVRELPATPTEWERGGAVVLPIEVVQALVTSPKVPLIRRVRYLLLATSGMREGEISGLIFEVLKLIDELPHFEIHRARRLERNVDEELGPLKTSTSRRGLPIHIAAVDALLEWAEDRDSGAEFYLGHRPLPSDPVFPSTRPGTTGSKFARPDTSDHLREDLKNAGLPTKDAKGRNFTAHALRKTFGTWLEQNGVDGLTRKRLMRHGANDVTADYYTGENFSKMRAAIATIKLTWNRDVPYEAPERDETFQDQVRRYLATNPTAKPPEVAEALGIRRATVAWIISRIKNGRLGVFGGAKPGAPGTIMSRKSGTSLEPRVGIEPTTCALRKRTDEDSPGVENPRERSRDDSGARSSSDRKSSSDLVRGVGSRNGTNVALSSGRASIDVGDVRVSTDVTEGEPLSEVTRRLARSLAEKGVASAAIESQLHIRPRSVCGGGS